MEENRDKNWVLIEEKETSYQMLTEGILLPQKTARLVLTEPEKEREIIINIGEEPYKATFRVNHITEEETSYEISYLSDKKISHRLQELFFNSFAFLHEANIPSPVKKIIKVPADKQEYYRLYYHLQRNAFTLEKSIPTTGKLTEEPGVPFCLDRLNEFREAGLLFDNDLLRRYALSLLTKPFVVLSGLSGSGKTRMALTFAKWLCKEDEQVKLVSVGADWNTREYLLGYPNALDHGKYIRPENGVVDFIVKAIDNPSLPYFLILDEMNLSYVERYFSDFLSAMESDEPIHLHPGTDKWRVSDIPAAFCLPPNLFITGTINVDETTYMFSPKVLDRANVIEFRINEEEMSAFLTRQIPFQPDKISHKAADMGEAFVNTCKNKKDKSEPELRELLLSFFRLFTSAGAGFGYRTASDILRFIDLAGELSPRWNQDQLIDIMVMQKMLPKLHGSRKKMSPVLTALWQLCLVPGNEVMIEKEEETIDHRFRYPLSAVKIRQMYLKAIDNGFTSYAEA